MGARDECFGLPNSGAIASIVFGLLIVIFGLSWVFGWEINYMAYFVVVFGVLIVAGAIYKLTRKNR
jgi:type IV secretory pathway VirB2 component (pilin)